MPNERDALRDRVLPQMILSEGSNPLTAPIPPDPSLTPSQRAQQRFAIRGNAIVTGGAGILGLEAVSGLLEHGASAICIFDLAFVLDSAASKIDALRAEFPHAQILTEPTNVTDEQSVHEAVARTVTTLGSIDILLCFAGVVGTVHAEDMSLQEWKRVLDINTTGTWICAQAVGKQMIKQQSGGSIVLTASLSAHRINFPQPQVSYNASKGALLQLARSLAAEWARYGIRVNTVSPGYMDTILNEGAGLEEGRKIWMSRNPMGRMGNPRELVGPVVLLCSEAGRYITGADILVDGGAGLLF